MKFRPCIDLHQGKVKQIVGSTLTDTGVGPIENFVAEHDADYYAEMFKRDNLLGGHMIMLGSGNEEQVRRGLQVYPGGLQVGGGITPENAASFLEQGAAQVIVTSYLFENGKLSDARLNRILSEVGRENLVIDLSCRQKNNEYYVVIDRWQTFTDFAVDKVNLRQLSQYCAEFLIHGVDVEGKQQGISEDLVRQLGEWTDIPCTYAGGVRTLEDLELIKKLSENKLDVTVGSALDIFGGKLSYEDVVNFTKN